MPNETYEGRLLGFATASGTERAPPTSGTLLALRAIDVAPTTAPPRSREGPRSVEIVRRPIIAWVNHLSGDEPAGRRVQLLARSIIAWLLQLSGSTRIGRVLSAIGAYKSTDKLTLSGVALLDTPDGPPLGGYQVQFIGNTSVGNFGGAATDETGIYVAFLQVGDSYTAYAYHTTDATVYRLTEQIPRDGRVDLVFQKVSPEGEPRTVQGTLRDAIGAPLAGWSVVLACATNVAGELVPITPLQYEGSITDATGAFQVEVPPCDGYVGVAYLESISSHALPLSITGPAEGPISCAANVRARRGKALLDGANPPRPLKRHYLVWRDTSDGHAGQQAQTGDDGSYELHEEQDRPYTVYAFHEVQKAWYVLTRVQDNADGSRDLHFRPWSWLNHPFARHDNPLGGAPDVASRGI